MKSKLVFLVLIFSLCLNILLVCCLLKEIRSSQPQFSDEIVGTYVNETNSFYAIFSNSYECCIYEPNVNYYIGIYSNMGNDLFQVESSDSEFDKCIVIYVNYSVILLFDDKTAYKLDKCSDFQFYNNTEASLSF